MKKKLLLFFLLLFVFIFSGCNNNEYFTVEYTDYYLIVGEEVEIKYILENIEEPNFIYEISEDIITIDGNVIKGKCSGECEVRISLINDYNKYAIIYVYVEEINPTDIEVDNIIICDLYSETQLKWQVLPSNASQEVEFMNYNKTIIEINDNGVMKTLKEGISTLLIISKVDSSIKKKITIEVKKPNVSYIETVDKITINYKESIQLEWNVHPFGANDSVSFLIDDNNIVQVNQNGLLYALCPGATNVYIISTEDNTIYSTINVIVNGVLANSIDVEENIYCEIGELYKLNFHIYPLDAYPDVKYIYDSECMNIDQNNILIGYKKGTYNLLLSTVDGSNIQKTVSIHISGDSLPIFKLYDCEQDTIINWGKEFDPLKGVRAFDGEDGDISENIVVSNSIDTKEYGSYIIEYTICDSDNNKCYLTRKIDVVWNYNVTFIGHGGCYYGAFNSEEAILYAATVLKYQAIEVDLKQTKDGVFVLSHDSKFGNYNLEDYTWDELKNVKITVTRKSGIPGSNGSVVGDGTYIAKLCTLDTFLEICKKYNIKAVIELKTSTGISNWTEQNNAKNSKMPNLIKKIEEAGMINNVILLSNQYECLIWTRKNGYDFIECQYLVSCCENQEYLDLCIKYNFDISMNVRDGIKNSDEWLNKYRNAGLKVAAYTFEEYASYETLQSYVDRGFDYLTIDWHDISKLNLPE